MMDFPLTLHHILERAAKHFARKRIKSRFPGGEHVYTYADFHARTHRLAHVLAELGIQPGERVGTLCWNSHRHLELYFAVPCYGAVLHTLNLRLAPDQLAYIINHADDEVIFVDESLKPLLDEIRHLIPRVRRVIVTGAEYEALLQSAPAELYAWPQIHETTDCAICYTSGTTGNPKGVMYTHRAIVLHTFSLAMVDSFAICERDVVLHAVPMFHVNGWGIPYTAVMTGAAIVFSGRNVQAADLVSVIESERVTFTAGVPTIWMGVYAYLKDHPADLSSLRLVICAGSAMPRPLLEAFSREHGVRFMLGWGMTETAPIVTVMALNSDFDSLPPNDRFTLMSRHGRANPGVEVRIVDKRGREIAWDGVTMGELQTRGLWVTGGYYRHDSSASFMADWFRTGDVATIDPNGYIQIMDRTKDLVKSGGEWISSVDLENILMGHPKIAEAAVIAVNHPKWVERPLACIVPAPGQADSLTKAEILEFLAPKVAKWWLPDDIVFIEAVPKTSVGKFNKRALRERFKDYTLP